jgi:hypothetical protein
MLSLVAVQAAPEAAKSFCAGAVLLSTNATRRLSTPKALSTCVASRDHQPKFLSRQREASASCSDRTHGWAV